ncbi:hypothetical protein AAFF_G00401500 [Aldrovandia affinis]|uniref:Uncharacterized protein n=1 Tax=Aldrovandia affinis TaxID=143900 RepID=A0AAD7SCG9_9TELE|nr:hypothetical protein AAFF_G00401500 [Aldrovandia affinis]
MKGALLHSDKDRSKDGETMQREAGGFPQGPALCLATARVPQRTAGFRPGGVSLRDTPRSECPHWLCAARSALLPLPGMSRRPKTYGTKKEGERERDAIKLPLVPVS